MPSGTSEMSNQDLTARTLQAAREMRPVTPPDNYDVDLQMWRGWVEPPEQITGKRGGWREPDDQLFKIPTQEMEEPGDDPKHQIWVTGNCPPWNCPGFWSYPIEQTFTICLREWEVDTLVGTIAAPEMGMLVIKSLSYDFISGLKQYELFDVVLRESGAERLRVEDMIIDPTKANPSHKYVFAGDSQPLDVWQRIDRNHKALFQVRARGVTDFSGTSTHAPGDPIEPSAWFRLTVAGWVTPLRNNNDGAPRATDLGNMENLMLDPDRYLEGF